MGYTTVDGVCASHHWRGSQAVRVIDQTHPLSPGDPASRHREVLGQPQTSNWVFFDRGVIDALGLPSGGLAATCARAGSDALHIRVSYFECSSCRRGRPSVLTTRSATNRLLKPSTFTPRSYEWYRSCGYVLPAKSLAFLPHSGQRMSSNPRRKRRLERAASRTSDQETSVSPCLRGP